MPQHATTIKRIVNVEIASIVPASYQTKSKVARVEQLEGTYAKCILQLDSPVLQVTLEFAALFETAHYAKHIQASGMT